MKVGVMTWFRYHNYGTALQVVALSKTIEKLKQQPYIVNYSPKEKVIKRITKSIIYDCYDSAMKKVRRQLNGEYTTEERERKFEQFLFRNLRVTGECNTVSELELLNEMFDVFVCGSDQIWAPSCFDPHFFLDFVYDTEHMIAYAPSVGLFSIDDSDIERQIKYLASRFQYISTRETSGSKIISDLIERPVETVLDPTFLMSKEEWNTYKSNIGDGVSDYLLAYMLDRNENHWKQIYQIANLLKLPVKIIPVFKKDLKRNGCIIEPIGPEDFVALINNASYVCTDSFHGMVFAINLNINFSVFERFKHGDKLNQNSRIYNVLEKLNLTNRLVRRNYDRAEIRKNINYFDVNAKIEQNRVQSFTYLKNAFENIEKNEKTSRKKTHVLEEHSLCCGCGACEVVCPVEAVHVKMDDTGFYSASINEERCISCGKCKEVCPFLELSGRKKIEHSALFSYKDADSDVLQTSSSGGFAFRLAQLALGRDLSVVGCTFDADHHKSRHMIINPGNENQLKYIQGSKYMQSEYAPIMHQLYKMQVPTVIFGTPCQIAATKRLLHSRRDVYYVDLICHGVPSYALYKKYMDYLRDVKKMDIEGMNTIFRYKLRGWRDIYIYNENEGKSIYTHQKKDPYFLMFEHGLCYAKSCYECPWRDSSEADIRIGDYWADQYKTDKTGVSMVAVLTGNGQDLMQRLNIKDYGRLKEEAIDDYFKCQQFKNNSRPVFWEELISQLNNKSDSLMDILKEYVSPLEKKKQLIRIYNRAKKIVKYGKKV